MNTLSRSPEPEVQVWPSYTDVAFTVILMLLLYLFVQSTVSSQAGAIMVEIKQRQKTMREVVEQSLTEEMRKNVTIDDGVESQSYRFSDQVLFDSGQAELKPSGKQILEAIGRAFKAKVGSYSRIQIEGHTDNIPLHGGGQFPSNWELSSARATSVVRFLQDKCELPPALMSANGYSEHQPYSTNETEAGRALNRRIEIKLFYTVPGMTNRTTGLPAR